jgi:PAS domain S-box-containing protein
MTHAPIPGNEKDRLEALRNLALMDTEREERFDRYTSLAARAFDVPIAQISLIGEDRQWIKSCFGADMRETERSTSFCGHTVAAGEMMVVPDACRDKRFQDNPFVVGPPKVRFYAGYPLWSGETHLMVGSLCIVDTHPRIFREEDRKSLRDIGELVREEFRNRAREMLLQSEERLNVLLTYSDSGFFDDNFERGLCYFSPRWKEILGYGDSELTNSYETFRSLLHPDDHREVSLALDPLAPGISPFSMEFRMKHKKGHWVWIESRGVTSADHQMRPKRHIGFINEITKRRQETERLRLLELCFERLDDGLLITDAQMSPLSLFIQDVNPTFERLTGFTREELLGVNPSVLKGPFHNMTAFVHQLFVEPLSFTGKSPHRDGSLIHGSWTINPLVDETGTVSHLITSLRDVTHPEKVEAGLEMPSLPPGAKNFCR